jgi:GT2 family glycosyltransferase
MVKTFQMKLGVALVVWNGRDYLRACINSLLAQTRRPDVLCVVDNGSTDQSLDIIRAYVFAFEGYGMQYLILANEDNDGFTVAANQAMRALTTSPNPCDLVVLLNQDVALDVSCLMAIEEQFRAHDDVGVVGCKIFYPDRQTIQHAGGFLERPRLLGRHRGIGDVDRPDYQVAYEPEYVTGAAIGLRTQALRQVGMFDPIFSPGYYEEVDLCLRMRMHGWRIRFTPDATLIHHESSSFRLLADYHTISHCSRLILAAFWLKSTEEWRLFEQAEAEYIHTTKDLAALQIFSAAYAKAAAKLTLQKPPRMHSEAVPVSVRLFGAAIRQMHQVALS